MLFLQVRVEADVLESIPPGTEGHRALTLQALGFSCLMEMHLAVVRTCLALHHKAVLKFPRLMVHVPSIKKINTNA